MPQNNFILPSADALTSQLLALYDQFGGQRAPLVAALRDIINMQREVLSDRFTQDLPYIGAGEAYVASHAALMDLVIQALYAVMQARLLPPTPFPKKLWSPAQTVTIIAVGGYGRAELAPYSDIDVLFLLPKAATAASRSAVEFVLYCLWDLNLKLGHAVRTLAETISMAQSDHTVRTALLEARFIAGDARAAQHLQHSLQQRVFAHDQTQFLAAKINERDKRIEATGDTRYRLEPNLKEGAGALRDLHMLFWLARHRRGLGTVAELLAAGLLNNDEAQQLQRARQYLLKLRCMVHFAAGRAEERLTFDVQQKLALQLGYRDGAGRDGVGRDEAGRPAAERLMKHYYMIARNVGWLTEGVREQLVQPHPEQKPLDVFLQSGRWILAKAATDFADVPQRVLDIFVLADKHKLNIHPQTQRWLALQIRTLAPALRLDATANKTLRHLITTAQNPARILRAMTDCGVLQRLIPDYGRIVAQMQFDMYHHYTVDEHTLRAVDNMHGLLQGLRQADFPLAHELALRVAQAEHPVLLLAIFVHDIAKGRGGDHSILGAEIALKLAPRLGFSEAETELVAWLVRWHLLLSDTALKRDLDDPQTLVNFLAVVNAPERLRLLTILTTADIAAVGPDRWTIWKASLIHELYARSMEHLTGGLAAAGRAPNVAGKQHALSLLLSDWEEAELDAHLANAVTAYWLAFEVTTLAYQARLLQQHQQKAVPLTLSARLDKSRSLTEVTCITADAPGLFSRLAGALAAAGANIIDARIFTLRNGIACDVFLVQSVTGQSFEAEGTVPRLLQKIEQYWQGGAQSGQNMWPKRAENIPIHARVLFDNAASRMHTVIEVQGRDRPGLLHGLTQILAEAGLDIASAKISTFGMMAVDVFYVQACGQKIDLGLLEQPLRQKLLAVLEAREGVVLEARELPVLEARIDTKVGEV